MVRIKTPKETFTVDYPEAVKFADEQAEHFWPHNEVKVHKDKQDILVNMTESERHGTITTLKLFTLYEQIIGDEFWLNFVFKKFPRPADIQPMAALFAAMELQVHAKFYAKINEELGLANDDFYTAYLDDPELKARIDFLENTLQGKDDLRSLGALLLVRALSSTLVLLSSSISRVKVRINYSMLLVVLTSLPAMKTYILRLLLGCSGH